jgi:hypothetical protein
MKSFQKNGIESLKPEIYEQTVNSPQNYMIWRIERKIIMASKVR